MRNIKKHRRFLFLLAMLSATTFAIAQNITGRIIDEQSQPMPFANVVLVNCTDSTYIAGAVTKDDGTFSISTDKQDGLLKVSSVGYILMYIDVGDIQMQPDTQTLGEVVVKGERPQYKMTTGGMTIDIQNSLLKDVGTADDVLSMLPRVQGEDGNFTVFAKGTPEIYINNKKVQNARELKQLKSTDIKSVDIITSPGAKYNAEVSAVIRIKTIRPQGEGVSLELYSYVKYNEKWATYDDATVKYRRGGLEVFGNVMINHGNHSEDNTLHTDTYANGNHISIDQYAPNSFWYTMPGGQIGASYDFNADNSIGMSYSLNGSIYEGGKAQTQQTIMRNEALEGQIDQLMKSRMYDNPQHEANIYYVGKVSKLGIETTSFAALLASFGVAVGMALSGNLQNFAGGILILIFRPYTVDDYVNVQDVEGTVTSIQIFHTIIRTYKGTNVYIPNGQMSNALIKNYSKEPLRMVEWIVSVEYGEDIKKVEDTVSEVIKADSRIQTVPKPYVAVKELAESSVNITIRVWTEIANYWGVYFDGNKRIYETFNEKGINFPFPQLTIHQGT